MPKKWRIWRECNILSPKKKLDAPLRIQKPGIKRYTKSSKKEKTKFEVTVGPRGTSEFIRVLGRICWRRRCFFVSSKFSPVNGPRYTSHLCHPCLWKIDLLLNPQPILVRFGVEVRETNSRFSLGKNKDLVLINAAFCSLKRFLQYFKLCAYFLGVGLDWLRFGSQRYHRIHRFKSFE